jgi:Short C-terminal domain
LPSAMTPEELHQARARLFGGLDGILQPGERYEVIIVGAFQQAVVGTDRRVIVYKAGPKSGTRFRRTAASWAYGEIQDIEIWGGGKGGAITVHPVVADQRVERYGAAGHGSPQQAPNAISLASRPGSAVVDRVEYLRERVAAARGGVGPPSVGRPAGTTTGRSAADAGGTAETAEELRKLGELREEGLLTEEEFQAKKAELLDRF